MKPGSTIQRRIADRLLAEGILSPEAHATALSYVGLHGGRMEDVIIDMQMMSEADLLQIWVRFVRRAFYWLPMQLNASLCA